jgi:PHS family inorganic phosphate transporter-like MFS transporter
LPHVLEIFALFMFLGIFTTMCIPETARKTLEELAGETIHHSDDDSNGHREIAKEAAVEEKATA